VDQGLKNSIDPLRQNRIQAQMSYKHLPHEEHFTIATLHDKKFSHTKIAEIIGRHPSTVWRELKRNSHANRSSLLSKIGQYVRNSLAVARD
jgi:IS30 family transposase